ncbi:MAG: glycosyltransferase family 4 protein [Chthoniobacter sp.]|nr:glycosyltransferase family 4 protein [Chthoniobacter sp.]
MLFSSFAHLVLEKSTSKVSGGAELQMALLARHLAQRGHDVVLLGTDEGQPDRRTLDGVRTRTGGRYHTGALLDTLRALPRVYRVLREERPEWVAVMGAGTWVFLLTLLRRRLGYSLAFISGSDIDVNGDYRRMNPVRGALYEFALRRVDRHIAMSEYQRGEFARLGFQPGIYRNLVPPAPEPAEASKDIDFLWVSSAQQLKRPDIFLDLAAALPQARCVMICPLKDDHALWESVRRRAAKIANLEFHPLVPYHEVQRFFHRARIFVNTSDFEGFPNTFLQAGMGRTALLSLRVDPDGMISRDGAGLCAGGSIGRLQEAAREMLGDAVALERMQSRCADYFARHHDSQANVDAFLATLATLAAR